MSITKRFLRCLFDPAFAITNGFAILDLLIIAFLVLDSHSLLSIWSDHKRSEVTHVEYVTNAFASAIVLLAMLYVYTSMKNQTKEECLAKAIRIVPAVVFWQTIGSLLGVFIFMMIPGFSFGHDFSKSESLNIMATIVGGIFLVIATLMGVRSATRKKSA